ncbi:MAG TPA: SDR family NAD(P)-dependent oxidoreductase [Vicinamibacterales bacterium]
MRLQNQTVLVTGGASGLGGATAEMIVAAGGRVIIADVNEAVGRTAAARLGASARFLRTDVTSEADVQQAIATAIKEFGAFTGVVNAAGIGPAARVVGRDGPMPLEQFARVIQINLIGTFNVVRLAAAAMMNNQAAPSGERGVIVNTASVAAYEGQIGQAAYAASKGGVISMTLPIARELARFGIRVMTIAPGIFDTPMLAAMPESIRESLGQQVPFPSRLGRPAEYAALVCHVFENEMLNGEVIRLDGAIRMAPK